jgi:hypothetical protein
MTVRGRHRRRVVAASGRIYSVCGLRRVVVAALPAVAQRSSAVVVWLSGATLLLVVSLSMYAVARPPTIPSGSASIGPVSAAERYSFADFVNAVR